MKIDYNI